MPLKITFAMPRKKYGETPFGERLASLRKARGFTQVQLARTANTTQRAISYYENEAGFPPVPAVLQLARALRVSTDELLGVKLPKVEHLNDGAETRRLWRRFQQMTALADRDQRAVIRLINSLVSAKEPRAAA
jgi:transcriptional regulator with XRE-family HTH domain